jgi:uncharacterized protein with LGFP repeats
MQPGSVDVQFDPIPTADAQRAAGEGLTEVARLAAVRTPAFDLVGVTWALDGGSAEVDVEVRVHTASGWGQWLHLEHITDEGPSTTEESDARAGTAPLWVGGADGAAVRVSVAGGAAPADLRLVRIDASAAAADTARSTGRVAFANPRSGSEIRRPPRFPRLPRVISRSQWGASSSLGDSCWSPMAGRTAKMVFVHHTAGSNRYSVRESPSIVRGIQAYHTQGQGWCDIGYNALIDRFGNIYEGRRGGFRKPIRGAHAGDFNTNTVGVSLMGNFETAQPPRATLNALVRFIGWRLGTSFTPVRGGVRVNGEKFARISGHRDAMSTSCPGRYVYSRLPHLRWRVQQYLTKYSSPSLRKADRLGRGVTGAPFIGERHRYRGAITVFQRGTIQGRHGTGAHWVSGRVARAYRQFGGAGGPLGWPSSDLHRGPRGYKVISFQRGRMYLPRRQHVKMVRGPVYDKYRRLGAARGRLGTPTRSVHTVRGGLAGNFRGGSIRWERRSDSFTVRFR